MAERSLVHPVAGAQRTVGPLEEGAVGAVLALFSRTLVVLLVPRVAVPGLVRGDKAAVVGRRFNSDLWFLLLLLLFLLFPTVVLSKPGTWM